MDERFPKIGPEFLPRQQQLLTDAIGIEADAIAQIDAALAAMEGRR